MRTLGRFFLILFSSLALAFNAVLIGLGWMRVLFYTGWITPNAAYPIVILFLLIVFGGLLSKTGATARAGAAVIVSSLAALILLIVFTMADNATGHAATAPLLGWFGMNTIIVEEEALNITALSGALIYPVLWLLTLKPALFFVRLIERKIPDPR